MLDAEQKTNASTMGLLSGSIVRKRSLAAPVSPPLTILHAQGDSVEVNVASNPRTDVFCFQEMQAKERELVYQKVILKGCRDELMALRLELEAEADPEVREELLAKARQFEHAMKGKKEKFVESYQRWKTSVSNMDISSMQAAETRE